jgi:uncharacterized membrane protein YbaN (DUF454 family)
LYSYSYVYALLLFLTPSNTVLPVAVAAVAMLLSWIRARRLPSLHTKPALAATAFGLLALYFFHKGLDDEKDWYDLGSP